MDVRALITANVGNQSRRQFSVNRVEAYSIATAMDSDADEFSVDIGMPGADLAFLLNRDNEVLVSLFTTGFDGTVEPLHQGIADTVAYSSSDGILSIKGRDYSAVAADSQGIPVSVKFLDPKKFVTQEAQSLGITQLQLAQASVIDGKFDRDGSETYWESWYRIYRKKGMWLWSEPNGLLLSGFLNYDSKPTVFLGRPTAGSSTPSSWIPVEDLGVTKSTQSRIGKIWVYGVHEKTSVGFRWPIGDAYEDKSISTWVKRPLRIITSSVAKDTGDAKNEALEEIFEGKVGAVELVAQVFSETIIRQNTMAYLNVPSMHVTGTFYVVGVTRQGDRNGNVQLVRLREKKYAISKRVPPDPVDEATDPGIEQVAPADAAATLGGIRWGNSFAQCAVQYHGAWDLKQFLGVLLAICQVESHFSNCIEGRIGVDWKPPSGPPAPGNQNAAGNEQYNKQWANETDNPLNDKNGEKGVGPMQLTTIDYKRKADDLAGNRDEYTGGRWIPHYNICAAAWALSQKLEGVPVSSSNIWIGVQAYNGSSNAVRYRNMVRSLYDTRFQDIASQADFTPTKVVAGDSGPAQGEPPLLAAFVALALEQRGKPYKYGATGPNEFDCSGLVDWCAKSIPFLYDIVFQAGAVPRPTTYTLWANPNFTAVKDVDKLLHGDLVFFEQTKGHMGIYIGNNNFLHAPHTGDVVKISSLGETWYQTEFVGGRRIVPWQPIDAKAGGKKSGGRIYVFQNLDWRSQDTGLIWHGETIDSPYAEWATRPATMNRAPKNGDTISIAH